MFPPLPPLKPRKGQGVFAPIAADINTLGRQVQELAARIHSLYPQPTPSVAPAVTPGGTTYTASTTGRIAPVDRLPFETFSRLVREEDGTRTLQIVGAPGTIGDETIPETVEEAPADGTWYFYTRVTIDATSGADTEIIAAWFSAVQTDTPTVGHQLMSTIEIEDGIPKPGFLEQYNFGPVYWFPKGGVDDKWEVVVV